MRILFVTPYPISRIRIRSYGFVSQLAKQHKITVLSLCAGEKDIADMWDLQPKGIAINAIQERRFQQYFRSLKALGTRLPLQVAFGAAPDLQSAISEQVSSGQFDLLHVEFIRALGALPSSLPIPVVWDAVDCISQLYEQGAHVGATQMLRLVGQYEARRVRAYESKQLHRFQQVLVTSERDRQALLEGILERSEGALEKQIGEITVIPHGIDQQYFRRYTGHRQQKTLIFSGKMSFHANVAGVLNFVEHILPRIWKYRPNVQLVIAGSNPPAKVRRLVRDPRIKVTGYVPDLRPYIAQAQVAVSPLPYAVGMQNKVLEAMALGTPVVASSSASAGLQVMADRDLLVADEPEAFADAVLRLLDNHVLRNELSECGTAYIARCHNWEAILKQLDKVYVQAVNKTALQSPGKQSEANDQFIVKV